MNGSNKIVILGAGPAGIAAASAAADRGAGVVLVESTGRLGGSVTAAMHRCLCGLYADEPSTAADTLNAGGQRRIIERMARHSPDAVKPRLFGKAWVLEFPPAAWTAALAETCDHPLIDRRMNTRVAAVRREGDRVVAVELAGDHAGRLETPVLLDCTGGGSVMRLLGDDVVLPDDPLIPRMLAGYAVRVAGITGHLELLRLQIPYTLARAVQKGELPPIARFTVFYPGPGEGEGVCKFAVELPSRGDSTVDGSTGEEHGRAARATDEIGRSNTAAGEVDAFARDVIAILQREIPGFADARIIETSPHALPRDGSRLRGRAVLTEADVLTATKRGLPAVNAWWPVERWDADAGPTYAYPPAGDPYEIPFDTLRSAAITNLFAAGNGLSATANAAASSRASGICLATGDAAGRIAAEYLRSQ